MIEQRTRPSLIELAKEIGVSAPTISRVLNGRPGIAKRTRKAVLSALEERGYSNKVVKGEGLRSKSPAIAFAISSTIRKKIEQGDPFYGRHLCAIQAAASQFGFYSILIDFEQDTTANGSLKCVEEGSVFGIVAEWMDTDLLETLRDRVGLVMLNRVSPVSRVDYVIPDIRHAVREQVKMLHELGHRSIACFRSLPGAWQNSHYWAEFWLQSIKFDLYRPPEFFEPIRFSENEERGAISAFLDRVLKVSQPPTAIITGDFYATFFIEECERRGFSVPESMSIVGFDDRPLAAHSIPLSTYRQDFDGMATEALRALVDRCKQPNLPSRVIEIAGISIPRKSVAAPRKNKNE